jgi:hypothetical protein
MKASGGPIRGTFGGGLVIAGSANNKESTKATFFAARDLVSTNPSEVWEVINNLRRHLRRDLKIFQVTETRKPVKEFSHVRRRRTWLGGRCEGRLA